MRNKITKRFCIICILLGTIILLYTGCGKRYTEEAPFKDVEDIANEEQINIHFAHKGKEFDDKDHYYFDLVIKSKWRQQKISRINCGPSNKKLGITIITEGNTWSIGNLYDTTEIFQTFSPDKLKPSLYEESEKQELQKIYDNANWRLKPIRDEYHFWIEDYIITVNDSLLDNNKKYTDLLYIEDENSGIHFTISLHAIITEIAT